MDKHATALTCLLGRIQEQRDFSKTYWYARDNEHATFDQHPFGHPVELRREGGDNHTTYLTSDLSSTDRSVRSILLMLQHELSIHRRDKLDLRLRITRVQIDLDWYDKSRYVHDLYFEIVSWNGTFICGGCNDCTGKGGHGGSDLETIFNLVGDLFEIPVEEATIPMGHRNTIDTLFRNTYRRHYESKNAA